MSDQQVSIGVKISEDLIKATLATHIANTLGNPGKLLADVVLAVLDKKKDSYSSTPTFLEELVRESIKPIAVEEWKKYLSEIEPDLRKMIHGSLCKRAEKEKLLAAVKTSLEDAFSHILQIEFKTPKHY